MDYLQWSQEYFQEADKVLRNIERLKAKLSSCPSDEYRTTEDKIMKLRSIYYECIHIAGYLRSRAGEKSHAA